MRVAFMGTPEFAVPTLDALAASSAHDVVSVLTRPDAVSGRGGKLRPSPVRARATELGLADIVSTPATLRNSSAVSELAALEPDAIVVAAYGCILPPEVLSIPRYGCLNVHGSLLPRWRGAAPIERAVLAGDAGVGVCIMQMEEGLDTGDFREVGRVPAVGRSAVELSGELARLGAAGMLETLSLLEAGECEWSVQDDAGATYADKLAKSDVLLAPELSAEAALRRVLASSASAPARCVVCGRGVRIVAAHLADGADAGGAAGDLPAQGEVRVAKGGVAIGLADGALELDIVRPDGKREMPAADWAAGLASTPERTWSAA